jgi:sRNA-binding regulator protein Hfq
MKNIALVIITSLIFNTCSFASQATTTSAAQTQTSTTLQAANMKERVQKRGEKSRVKVILSNGTVVDGNISRIEDSSFDVTYKKTGQATTIAYADVQKVGGPGLSTGEKVAIGVGIGIGVVAILLAVAYKHTQDSLAKL